MYIRSVLVTGGAGYVGAVLVPKLLHKGYRVKVVDWYIFGDQVFHGVSHHPNLEQIRGDIRDSSLLKKALIDVDAVIHLACISNDPSYDLDPALGKSINYDATVTLVDLAIASGVKRFIYASTSSVYGVKREKEVTEDLPLEPLTEYSKYKALSEEYLLAQGGPEFTVLVIRPATVCGYSPRMRLDLTVNILTMSALVQKKIIVYGGRQKRPNIHIDDMTDLYVCSLAYSDKAIAGKIYNAGNQNYTISTLARMVKTTIGDPAVRIEREPTNDLRSYHVSSRKIARELGFVPKRSIQNAIVDLQKAYQAGKIPRPFDDPRYYNIKTMAASRNNLNTFRFEDAAQRVYPVRAVSVPLSGTDEPYASIGITRSNVLPTCMKRQQPQSNTAAYVSAYIAELKRCLDRLDIDAITRVIDMIMQAYKAGRTVFIMGNGGSAATASHMACDLGKGTLARVYDMREARFRVIALTDNVATITAYANDLAYEDIFIQQLRNLMTHGDVVIALSGSGNSSNVVKAVRFAKRRKAKTIGFLGFKTGGILGKLVDCAIIVDSDHYGPCEDIQLVLDHIVTSCLARMKGAGVGDTPQRIKNAAVPFRLQPA